MNPTTVRAVEQAYFKNHQYLQQMRPLAEVIGTGNFFFLQESELDSPDINATVPNNVPGQPQTIQPKLQQQAPQQQQQQQAPNQTQPPAQQPIQQQNQPTIQASQIQTHWAQKSGGVTTVDIKSTSVDAKPTTFTNQSFPTIHNPQTNSFPNVVGQNQQQQPHIPGFATPNALIQVPIPSAQSNVPAVLQTNASPNAAQILVQQQPQTQPGINPFPNVAKFVNPSNVAPSIANEKSGVHDLHANVTATTADIKDQHVNEISEWKPDEVTHVTAKLKSSSLNHHHSKKDVDNSASNNGGSQANNSNAWRDPYSIDSIQNAKNVVQPTKNVQATNWPSNKNPQESNEWNGVPNENGQDESTWTSNSNSNQRYQYRQGSGGYRSNGGGRNSTGKSNNLVSNNGSRDYRGGRQNSSYNNGNNNSAVGGGTGGGAGAGAGAGAGGTSRTNGNGNNGSSSFYRNNDFYQSNGSRSDKTDNYNGRSGGAGNQNYRGRDSRDNNTSSYKQRNVNNNGNNISSNNNSITNNPSVQRSSNSGNQRMSSKGYGNHRGNDDFPREMSAPNAVKKNTSAY